VLIQVNLYALNTAFAVVESALLRISYVALNLIILFIIWSTSYSLSCMILI